jgi:hypothetical protein
MTTKNPQPTKQTNIEPTNERTAAPGNAFTHLLSQFRSGASLAELSERLQRLVAAVRETGQKGKLIYTLTIKPAATGNQALLVVDAIETKEPKLERDQAVFFATEENTLQRDNPQQRNLDLRTVERPVSEIREVGRAA